MSVSAALRDLGPVLSIRQKMQVFVLLAGMVLAAALELVGIAAVPAFVALLVEPGTLVERLTEWPMLSAIAAMDHASIVMVSAGLLVVLFLVKNLSLAGLSFLEGKILREITVETATRLFRAYLFSPYVMHLLRNPAELIGNVNNAASDSVEYIHSSLTFLREGLVVAVVVALMLLMDPMVALSVFALLGVAAAAFHFAVRRTLAVRGAHAQSHHARQLQVLNESLGAVKLVRMLGREQYALDRFRQETQALWRHETFYRVITTLPRLFLEVFAVAAVLMVVVLFVVLGREVTAMLPVLALLVVALVRLTPAFSSIGASLGGMQYHRRALAIVAGELSALQQEPAPEAAPVLPLSRTVELHQVGFRYPGAASDALFDVSLSIAAGEAVGIAGPTGAGKSTLIDVILGLLEPTRGSVRVDGVDIRERTRAWQAQIGYVPQDVYLLDDTIRRNVAFGVADREIDEAALAVALEAAQLKDFVDSLPVGLESTVGNRGVRLSGGQRQRIGIARALYRQPKVLVMDEATSSLDNDTEAAVIESIARLRGERTIIIIAHRASTLASCDRVVYLNAGRLAE